MQPSKAPGERGDRGEEGGERGDRGEDLVRKAREEGGEGGKGGEDLVRAPEGPAEINATRSAVAL